MASKRKSKIDRGATFYKQGFLDATSTGWFRWERHPNLNSYRLGFKHGEQSMRKYDKQAQDWVNNPHAWQDHEEDHIAEQFKELWQSAKTPLMVLFCIAVISGWAIWL